MCSQIHHSDNFSHLSASPTIRTFSTFIEAQSGEVATFEWEIDGYPLPSVSCRFKPCPHHHLSKYCIERELKVRKFTYLGTGLHLVSSSENKHFYGKFFLFLCSNNRNNRTYWSKPQENLKRYSNMSYTS